MKEKNESLIQAIKFTLFSISAGIIQVLVFTALEELPPLLFGRSLGYWPCYLPALIASVVWNFTFNRKFTFQSAANVPIAMLKVALYYAVFTPVSTVLGNLAAGHVSDYLILALTMLTNFVTEFLFDKYVVFTDVRAKAEN
ncbi:MAG TPA: GtrA family protein [Candidatus Faecousia faecipullorum]|nr:GtrA family protein [Candidatus Faecousia faecipullorum]